MTTVFEHSWGTKFDELLAYETPRIVRIRDARLGALYYLLVLAILLYVIGYQILMNNSHFERRDVLGTPRMTMQQPTKGNCNPNEMGCKSDFDSLEALPYCKEYMGDAKDKAADQKPCIFADQHTLAPYGMLGDTLLVPTRIDYMRETKGCTPAPGNGWTCDNEYRPDPHPTSTYIADVQDYGILIAHTFKRDTISGNNGEYLGYYLKCESADNDKEDAIAKMMTDTQKTMQGQRSCDGVLKRYPIQCINDKCPYLDKKKTTEFLQEPEVRGNALQLHARRPKVSLVSFGNTKVALDSGDPKVKRLLEHGLFAIPEGDVIRISTLMELAGVHMDTTRNRFGDTLRTAGTVIEIEVTYDNLYPFWSSFGYTDVTYDYRITKRPMEEMKTEKLALHQPNFPETRIIENHHGLLFIVRISGTFGFFSSTYFLIVLVTALGMLRVATIMVDKIACYILRDKDHYREAKYELTEAWSQREAQRQAEHQKEDEE